MSTCPCCEPIHGLEPINLPKRNQVRPALFNWVTALMLTGWVGIVTMAFKLAGADNVASVPTLEDFLRTLL